MWLRSCVVGGGGAVRGAELVFNDIKHSRPRCRRRANRNSEHLSLFSARTRQDGNKNAAPHPRTQEMEVELPVSVSRRRLAEGICAALLELPRSLAASAMSLAGVAGPTTRPAHDAWGRGLETREAGGQGKTPRLLGRGSVEAHLGGDRANPPFLTLDLRTDRGPARVGFSKQRSAPGFLGGGHSLGVPHVSGGHEGSSILCFVVHELHTICCAGNGFWALHGREAIGAFLPTLNMIFAIIVHTRALIILITDGSCRD